MERGQSFEPETNYFGGQMQADQTVQGELAKPMVVELTPDELRTLKECQYNAVFHRGLPLGGATFGGIYLLMKSGVMTKNRFSLALSGVTGFVMGTMSYRRICMEKLMALPNGTLKDRILMAQGKQPHVRVEVQSQDQLLSWFDSEAAPMTSSLDIEPYNQSHRFGDLPTRPDAESAYVVDPPLQPIVGTPYTTYDDLRRNNREQYERTMNYGYRTPDKTDTMRQPPNDPGPPSYDNRLNDPMPPLPARRSDDFI